MLLKYRLFQGLVCLMLKIIFTQFSMSGSYVTDPISTKCEHVTQASAIRIIQLPTAMTESDVGICFNQDKSDFPLIFLLMLKEKRKMPILSLYSSILRTWSSGQ